MKILYLISIALLICTNLNGQTSLTLQEAVNYGTNNNVEYKNANLDLQIAQQKVKESISTGLPKIQSSLGVQNYIDIPTTVIPSNAFNPLADPNDFEELQFGTSLNASATIRLDQLIFSATYIAGLKAARVYKGLTEKITSKTLLDTKENVISAYYGCLIFKENETLLTQSLENLEKIQQETNVLVKEGIVEEINLDQINVLVLQMKNQINQLNKQTNNAISLLKYVIGFPQDSTVVIANKLADFPQENTSLSSADFSATQMLDYQIIEKNRELTELTHKMNTVSGLPTVSGFFSHQQTALRNEFNLFDNSKSWYPATFWGINVAIPIFTSGESSAISKQSALEVKKAENVLFSVEEGLKQQFTQVSTNYHLALIALENDKKSLLLSEKILSNTTKKFSAGFKSGLDVAQAQNQELNAQNKLLQSHFNLLMAKLKRDKIRDKL